MLHLYCYFKWKSLRGGLKLLIRKNIQTQHICVILYKDICQLVWIPDLDLKREVETLKPHLFILIFFLFLSLETFPDGLQTQNATAWCYSVQKRM